MIVQTGISCSTDEAVIILQQVSGGENGVCSTPPVKPKGGDVFVYFTQNDRSIRKWL